MEMTGERFLKGMTPKEHVARMKVNKDRFVEVMAAVEIPPEVRNYFAGLTAPPTVAVVTEDWCGDHVTHGAGALPPCGGVGQLGRPGVHA